MPVKGARSDLTARIQFRVTEITRERAELAAAELELDLAEWCRAVFEAACEAHFEDRQLRTVEIPSRSVPGKVWPVQLDDGGRPVFCPCPSWGRRGRCPHGDQAAAYGPDGYDDTADEAPDDYAARLDAEAADLRRQEHPAPAPQVVHPGVAGDNQEETARRSPRECPHLPQWRVGSRCSAPAGGCGATVGGTTRLRPQAGFRT